MATLTLGQKLLVVLYELAAGTSKPVKFEDIVVKAFKKYPKDFCLRGYEMYPDASDKVHRPLYNLRKQGFVNAREKFFSLTAQGIAAAEKLTKFKSDIGLAHLPRDSENEIKRVMASPGFKLFLEGRLDQLVDTDFFDYLAVSVRSERTDFISRVKVMTDIYKHSKGDKRLENYRKYHEYLFSDPKFKEIISIKTASEREV